MARLKHRLSYLNLLINFFQYFHLNPDGSSFQKNNYQQFLNIHVFWVFFKMLDLNPTPVLHLLYNARQEYNLRVIILTL